MKKVSAEVHSSTPVTISKAASVLSKFVSSETGASQAVNAYLRRATAALDELVRLHSKSGRRKHNKRKSDSSAVTATGGTPSRSAELSQEPISGFENGSKKLSFGNMVDDTETRRKKKASDFDEGRVGEEIERTKHKKKRRNRDSVGDSEVIAVEIENRVVVKRRENKKEDRIHEHAENVLNMDIEKLKKEDRKKRKNREVEEGSRDEPEEQRSNKKRKRRRNGEDAN